jgi:enamine deaminase RidA (YjgF/YER057c/UK114 family)
MRSVMLASLMLAAPAMADAPAAAAGQTIVSFPSRDGQHRAYHEWTYAHATRVGDMIWVSGVPGQGKTLGEQTRFALERIKRAIEAAGGSMDDVVELMSFHMDLSPDTFGEIAAVRRELFPGGFTSWTAVGTTGLLAPGAMLEIRAVAVVGSGRKKEGAPEKR